MKRFICHALLMVMCAATPVLAQAAGPYYRIEKLRDPSNISEYYPRDINNQGMVVGSRYLASEGREEAFLYRGGTVELLGTLGGPSSQAWAINEHGDITGTAYVTNDEAHAYIYRAGRMTSISAPPTNEGGSYSGFGINNQGHVLGQGRDSVDHQPRPFFYDGTRSRFLSIPADLVVQEARAINDRDEIVGGTGYGQAYYYH